MLGYINTCLTVVTGVVFAIILAIIGLTIALAEPEAADAAGQPAIKRPWSDPPSRSKRVGGGHA